MPNFSILFAISFVFLYHIHKLIFFVHLPLFLYSFFVLFPSTFHLNRHLLFIQIVFIVQSNFFHYSSAFSRIDQLIFLVFACFLLVYSSVPFIESINFSSYLSSSLPPVIHHFSFGFTSSFSFFSPAPFLVFIITVYRIPHQLFILFAIPLISYSKTHIFHIHHFFIIILFVFLLYPSLYIPFFTFSSSISCVSAFFSFRIHVIFNHVYNK